MIGRMPGGATVGANGANGVGKGGGGGGAFGTKPEIRATMTALFIIGLYLMAWSPYATMVVIGQFSPYFHSLLTPRATTLPALFAKCASLYNPFV